MMTGTNAPKGLTAYDIHSPDDLERFWLEGGDPASSAVSETISKYGPITKEVIIRLWLHDPEALIAPFYELDAMHEMDLMDEIETRLGYDE